MRPPSRASGESVIIEHVHNHIHGSHDAALVVVAVLIAVAASFVALDVAGRLYDRQGQTRLWWLALAATVMGGGIWAMHFVAMLSFEVTIPVAYDLPWTAASLLVAIVASAGGLAAAGTRQPLGLTAGGLFMGSGIAAMHYIGMEAALMQADVQYEPLRFALSILIALAASTAALWLAFRVRAYWQKAVSALAMGLAVSGMHFVAMSAAQFHPFEEGNVGYFGHFVLSPMLMVVAVSASLFFLLLLGVISTVADRRLMTSSARAEHEMELSAKRHRSLVRNSSDIIAIIDARAQFTYCGESARRILGFAPSWLLGRRLDEFMSPADLGEFYAFLGRVQGESGVNMTAEIELRHADGRWRAFEITCCDLRADAGIGGIIANLRDVTERKREHDDLLAAMDQAERANRSKSAFLAAMSHELRTPLNAIIGFSEVITSGMLGQDAGPKAVDYATHIQESGKHLLSLINDILDLSKAESGKMSLAEDYVRPADVVAECLRMVAGQTESQQVKLDVTVAQELPYLFGDRRRVRQVLLNILSNAIKFTPAGGRVTLHVGVEGQGGDLLFVVSDSGIGMTADEIVLALEPFRQVDSRLSRKYEGTGLGLPLTNHLMEMHGGRMEIASTPAVGTTVTLRFPKTRLHTTFTFDETAGPCPGDAKRDGLPRTPRDGIARIRA